MGVYKVESSGSAPKGLSVGDDVVTGGGTYKITGVNADGTYKSSLSNAAQTTANYTGSYNTVSRAPTTVQVGADGNAPSGTQVGDTVKTAGGDYHVVSAGTPGASYNPSSGLYSVKVGSNTAPAAGNYLQVGSDGNAPSNAQVGDIIQTAGGNYQVVNAGTSGASYNPSSGLWSIKYTGDTTAGSGTASNSGSGGLYPATSPDLNYMASPTLPSYEAQTDKVNDVYSAAQKAALAALKSSYDNSRLNLEYEESKIPALYQEQARQIASQAEIAKRNYNEIAAGSGLNYGNGSQAQLAMNNQLQSNLSSNYTAQANAQAEIRNQLSTLYTNYQNSISEAMANNEYEKAAALMNEYQKAAESVVNTAYNQGLLDVDVAQYNQGVSSELYNRKQQEEQTAYDRQQKEAETEYQRAWDEAQRQREWAQEDAKAQAEADAAALDAEIKQKELEMKIQQANQDYYIQQQNLALKQLEYEAEREEAKAELELKRQQLEAEKQQADLNKQVEESAASYTGYSGSKTSTTSSGSYLLNSMKAAMEAVKEIKNGSKK